MRNHPVAIVLACQMVFCIPPSEAAVVEYTNKPAWQSAVNSDYLTIDFTGFPSATFITTQYSSVGVTFTDGSDFIVNSPSLYLNDGSGLDGNTFSNPDVITVSFAAPQNWIGASFPGSVAYKLYQNSSLIYTSPFEQGGGGLGHFYGVTSDTWFNKVVLFRYTGLGVNIDDLYYNAAPAPGGLAGLGIGCLLIRTRRRPSR